MTSRDEMAVSFLNSEAISDDFFIELVEKKLNITRDEFKLRLVLLSPATGKNENYVAVLYRAKIKIEILATNERTSVDVIIKALLSMMPEMKEFGVFPRERFVYENVLASFEEIWLERAGEVVTFGPRIIKSESDPYEQLVLDDLKAEGFEMMDRKVGLSFEQTKAVLAKLAKFHAASSVRYQKEGIIQTYFDRKATMPPRPENPADDPFFNGFYNMMNGFIDEITKYGDCDVYVEKLKRWDLGCMMMQWIEVAEPMKCGFTVLNHGDMWLNNMMFKSDEAGNPLEVKLIDYQLPFWGSPSGDLLYFLISSVADDIKVENFDNFIEFYYLELVESLKKLNYDHYIPTMTDLHIDLLNKGAFGASCLMMILFIVKYESQEEINLEVMFKGEKDQGLIERVYSNETYKKSIKLWLPFLNKRGFLDAPILPPPAAPIAEEKKEE